MYSIEYAILQLKATLDYNMIDLIDITVAGPIKPKVTKALSEVTKMYGVKINVVE